MCSHARVYNQSENNTVSFSVFFDGEVSLKKGCRRAEHKLQGYLPCNNLMQRVTFFCVAWVCVMRSLSSEKLLFRFWRWDLKSSSIFCHTHLLLEGKIWLLHLQGNSCFHEPINLVQSFPTWKISRTSRERELPMGPMKIQMVCKDNRAFDETGHCYKVCRDMG